MNVLEVIADCRKVMEMIACRERIVNGAFDAITRTMSVPRAEGEETELIKVLREAIDAIIEHARKLLGDGS